MTLLTAHPRERGVDTTVGPSSRYVTSRFVTHAMSVAAAATLAMTPAATAAAAVIIGLGALLAARRKHMHLVGLLLVVVPYSGVYLVGVPATVWFLVGSGGVLAIRVLAEDVAPRQPPRAAAALLLLTFVACHAVIRPPDTAEGAFVAAETAVLLVAVAVLSILPVRTGETTYPIEVTFVGVAVAAGVSALYSAQQDAAQFAATRQLTSLIGGSNYAAVLVAAAGVLVVLLWQKRALSWPLALSLSAFFVYVPIALGSRTASLVMVAVVAASTAWSRHRSVLRATVMGAAIALVAWRGSGLLASRLTSHDLTSSLEDRWTLWSTTTDVLQQHWLTGAGPGGLVDALSAVSLTWYPHNFLLSWTAQFGIVAGLLLAAVLVPLAALTLRTPAGAAYVTVVLCSLVEPAVDTHRVGLAALALTVAAVTWADRVEPRDR